MKVLIITSKYPPEYSGSGLRAHRTYKRLAIKYGVRFDVLCDSVAFGDRSRYQYDGVSVNRVARPKSRCGEEIAGGPGSRGNWLSNAFRYRLDYLFDAASVVGILVGKHRGYDAFHVFGNTNVTAAAITFAKVFRRPLIVEFTSDRASPHSYEAAAVRWLWGDRLPERARIVCISPKLREMCNAFGYEDNVWCRPNPIDETRFFPEPGERERLRRKHTGFRDEDVVLCYVAKFMPTKQQLFLVDVLRRLPEKYKLMLAGPLVDSGPLAQRDRLYFDQVVESAKRWGVQGRLKLDPAFVDRPEELMKMSDIYVFPSSDEGLGTPVLEAIACGIPVVAHRMAGVTDEWMVDGKSGFLSSLDAAEFATKVQAAARIPRETLLLESQRILRAASTATIDQGYYDLLCDVIHPRI